MAQGQNKLAAIFGALNLIPYLTNHAEQNMPGAPGAAKHSAVASIVASIIGIGGLIVEANNPTIAPLIDASIKTAVAVANSEGWMGPVVPESLTPAVSEAPISPQPSSASSPVLPDASSSTTSPGV